jgi:amidophosphoribosyltransferase
VDMVRKAGAKRVYLASASPPVIFPNVYGVDLPSKKEFVANNLSIDQVRQVLGADGLLYQTVEDLLEVAREMNPSIKEYDASVFDGKYVTGTISEEYLSELEAGRGSKRRSGQKASLTSPAAAAV